MGICEENIRVAGKSCGQLPLLKKTRSWEYMEDTFVGSSPDIIHISPASTSLELNRRIRSLLVLSAEALSSVVLLNIFTADWKIHA